MKLILVRHGNTFEAGEPAPWVGGADDLPLVDRGREQAHAVADALAALHVAPVRVLAAPLQRTWEMAEIIADTLGATGALDREERLREIDYGTWAMKTTEQLIDEVGPGPVEDWQLHSKWPDEGGWSPGEDQVKEDVQELVWDLVSEGHRDSDVIVLVSSNGILRYFLTLIDGEFERRLDLGDLKMATGSLSMISFADDLFEVEFWNVKPDDLVPSPGASLQ